MSWVMILAMVAKQQRTQMLRKTKHAKRLIFLPLRFISINWNQLKNQLSSCLKQKRVLSTTLFPGGVIFTIALPSQLRFSRRRWFLSDGSFTISLFGTQFSDPLWQGGIWTKKNVQNSRSITSSSIYTKSGSTSHPGCQWKIKVFFGSPTKKI